MVKLSEVKETMNQMAREMARVSLYCQVGRTPPLMMTDAYHSGWTDRRDNCRRI
jgi:hypothetical protein